MRENQIHGTVLVDNCVFKIRRKSDGLYSTGGVNPTFTRVWKAWASRGNINQHLAQFETSDALRQVYGDCEIVVYSLSRVIEVP